MSERRNSFHLQILAADRDFYEGPCEMVTITSMDGEMEFLAHHSNCVAAIIPGELRYCVPAKLCEVVSVGPGVIKVTPQNVLVLVDSVERLDEIDENRVLHKMDEALEALRQKQSIREYRLAQANLARAAGRLRVRRHYIQGDSRR